GRSSWVSRLPSSIRKWTCCANTSESEVSSGLAHRRVAGTGRETVKSVGGVDNMKRKLTSVAVASALAGMVGAAGAQISDGVVKIGVMNDMSGLYSDITGMGSVVAARLAVEDFQKTSKAKLKVEIVSADHQNKPDVGSTVARQWYDTQGVDTIVDVPTSSVGL